MVPAGARQIDWIAGDAGAAGCAQAASRKVAASIRGILRGFGLKVGQVTRKTFESRIRELATGQATLERIAEAMLSARVTLQAEYEKLHKAVLAIVREDAVSRRPVDRNNAVLVFLLDQACAAIVMRCGCPLVADFVAKVGDQRAKQATDFLGTIRCHPLH
jgi:transposase